MSEMQPLLPGATVGVIGGGQLGRYFVLEARRLGYVTYVLDPDANAPAMQVCDKPLAYAYDNETMLEALATACDAVTIEFENVPAASLSLVAKHTRIAPSADVVTVAQDRNKEKQTATTFGLKPVPYAVIESSGDIDQALKQVQLPAILKTSRLGYDGKGQQTCNTREEVEQAFSTVNQVSCVLEQRINLKCEISVVLARGFDGRSVCFPVAENVHTNGVLDTSVVPATVDDAIIDKAKAMATTFADGLDYVGVLAIEFFIDNKDQLLFNEMAPRPHNSGHYTLDATVCSQFEQQVRALCALPLGSTQLLSPVCMLNVLGDTWPSRASSDQTDANNPSPSWHAVLQQPGAHLHSYGKAEARPGRKMGHINCLAESGVDALTIAHSLRSSLQN